MAIKKKNAEALAVTVGGLWQVFVRLSGLLFVGVYPFTAAAGGVQYCDSGQYYGSDKKEFGVLLQNADSG